MKFIKTTLVILGLTATISAQANENMTIRLATTTSTYHSGLLVNPSHYPDINYQGAKTFSDWLVNPKAQQMINDYKVADEQLFEADALTQ